MIVREVCSCGAVIELDHNGASAENIMSRALVSWRTDHRHEVSPQLGPGGVLLPPDTLVIVKEEGKWPRWAWNTLFRFFDQPQRPNLEVLDALAAAQPGRETGNVATTPDWRLNNGPDFSTTA
jgi:hypothetical protein